MTHLPQLILNSIAERHRISWGADMRRCYNKTPVKLANTSKYKDGVAMLIGQLRPQKWRKKKRRTYVL